MLHDPRRDVAEPIVLQGEAVAVLREIETKSVDLIYSDPPFGNRQQWTGKAGSFSDRWNPDGASRAGWALLEQHKPGAAGIFGGLDQADRAYLGMMAGLLFECRRVLKLTGTLWLHFDDTMGAYLRVLGDLIFGPQLQLGTMIWRRTASHGSSKDRFGRVHDTIACWLRSRAAEVRLWRIGVIPGDPLACEDDASADPVAIGGFFETPPLSSGDSERIGYPTQKPIALIEEIIAAASLPGDLVLDPTCGSGTTLLAAKRLARRAIGIDMSADAIKATYSRLERARPLQSDLFA